MPRNNRGLADDADFVARFTALWEAGVATTEIGERLGLNKNKVCGLRYRFKLTPRGSPIRRDNPQQTLTPSPARARRPRASQAKPPTRGPEAVSRDTWMAWFTQLSPATRRLIAAAPHASDCPLQSGGGLWSCNCGISQRGSVLARHVTKPEPPSPSPDWYPAPPPADPRLDHSVWTADVFAPPTWPEPAWMPPLQQPPTPMLERMLSLVRPVEVDGAAPREQRCCFPKGEPRTPSFRFCDTPYTGRGPYCAECHKNAYVKIKDKAAAQPDWVAARSPW